MSMYFFNGGYIPSMTLKPLFYQKTDANAVKGIKVDVTQTQNGNVLTYNEELNQIELQPVNSLSGAPINPIAKGDGKVLVYKAAQNEFQFETIQNEDNDTTIDGIPVDSAGVANNKVLTYNSGSNNIQFQAVPDNTIDGVPVVTSGKANNKVLTYNSGSSNIQFQTVPDNTIDGTLVDSSAKGNGKSLVFNSGSNHIEYQTVGGGGGNPFNQDLNTTDSVTFQNVTATQNVQFPGEDVSIRYDGEADTIAFTRGIYTPSTIYAGAIQSCGGASTSFINNVSQISLTDGNSSIDMSGGTLFNTHNIQTWEGMGFQNTFGASPENVFALGNSCHAGDSLEAASMNFNFDYGALPNDGDYLQIYSTLGNYYYFEFDNNSSVNEGAIPVTIGANSQETASNFAQAVANNAGEEFSVTLAGEEASYGEVNQLTAGEDGNTGINTNLNNIFYENFNGGTDDAVRAFAIGYGAYAHNNTINIGNGESYFELDFGNSKFNMSGGPLHVNEIYLSQDGDNYANISGGEGNSIVVRSNGGSATLENSVGRLSVYKTNDYNDNSVAVLNFYNEDANSSRVQLNSDELDLGNNSLNGAGSMAIGYNNNAGDNGDQATLQLTFSNAATDGQIIILEAYQNSEEQHTYTFEFSSDGTVQEGNVIVPIGNNTPSTLRGNFAQSLSGVDAFNFGYDGSSSLQIGQRGIGVDGNTTVGGDYFTGLSFENGKDPSIKCYTFGQNLVNDVNYSVMLGFGNNYVSITAEDGILHLHPDSYISTGDSNIIMGSGAIVLGNDTEGQTNRINLDNEGFQLFSEDYVKINSPSTYIGQISYSGSSQSINNIGIGFSNTVGRAPQSASLTYDFSETTIFDGDKATFSNGIDLEQTFEFDDNGAVEIGNIRVPIGTTGYIANLTNNNFLDTLFANVNGKISGSGGGVTGTLTQAVPGAASNTSASGSLAGVIFPPGFFNGSDTGPVAGAMSYDFGNATIVDGDDIVLIATDGTVFHFEFDNNGVVNDGRILVSIGGNYSAENTENSFSYVRNHLENVVFNMDTGNNTLTQVFQGTQGNTEVTGNLSGNIFQSQFSGGEDYGTNCFAFGKSLSVTTNDTLVIGIGSSRTIYGDGYMTIKSPNTKLDYSLQIHNESFESQPEESGWLTQKENGELVWAYNVNPQNDTLDNTSNSAYKFSIQGIDSYDGVKIQAMTASSEGGWGEARTILYQNNDGRFEVSGALGTSATSAPTVQSEGDQSKLFFWLDGSATAHPTPMYTALNSSGTTITEPLSRIRLDSNGNLSVGSSLVNSNSAAGYTPNIAIGSSGIMTDAGSPASGNIGIGMASTLGSITNGTANIGIGENAMSSVTAGANNIGIGSSSNVINNTINNSIALGTSATTRFSNSCMLGSGPMMLGMGASSGPSDDSLIQTGQMYTWFDATPGSCKIKFRGKDSNGTVVTGEIPLT